MSKVSGCGVDLEEISNDGWTALMWAAEKGLISIVKILIENGSAKKEDWKGYTALMFAVIQKSSRHRKH